MKIKFPLLSIVKNRLRMLSCESYHKAHSTESRSLGLFLRIQRFSYENQKKFYIKRKVFGRYVAFCERNPRSYQFLKLILGLSTFKTSSGSFHNSENFIKI